MEDLKKRVQELEAEVAKLRGSAFRGVRYRSAFEIAGIPFIAIATGVDPAKGEMRGHAKGIIAIGDIATGVIALGGLARGIFALGGLAVGVVSLGGLSIGALLALGGLAIGGFALGGGAIGYTAAGGGAVGEYACGGGVAGHYVIGPMRRDPEAVAHFAEYGLEFLCGTSVRRRY